MVQREHSVSASSCAVLTKLSEPNTEITSAIEIPMDRFKVPSPPGPPVVVKHPAFCRVQGILKPTGDSNIGFEVWLPSSGWNERFEQLGNGGYAGEIPSRLMMPELRRGFAVAGTDDGHMKGSDESWAMRREKVIDYGYRAVHETSNVAKKIIEHLLWQRSHLLILRWVFRRRPRGTYGSATLSRRLQWHHCGRTGKPTYTPHGRNHMGRTSSAER